MRDPESKLEAAKEVLDAGELVFVHVDALYFEADADEEFEGTALTCRSDS